jgi:16S rRNA C1402 N4-methylase RsmH
MDFEDQSLTAREVVNMFPEAKLADIIYKACYL